MGDSTSSDALKLDLSTSMFAARQSAMNALMEKLRASGISSNLQISLPRIAVIGSQSAGKSSLIEGISGINLPRADGTCTRVPTEVMMSHKEGRDWQCSVKLRFEVDEKGTQLPHVRNIAFDSTTDPTKVADILRRAQLAILNPSVDALKFRSFNLDTLEDDIPPLGSTKQFDFSENLVAVHISGSDVVDLSLVDLPGIIQSGDESVALIKGLAQKYIKDEGTLILLAITMKDDLENQEANSMARKADAAGQRTIGICTKPDTLAQGEIRKWMGVINNVGKQSLNHGYYVARQPDLAELEAKISHADARKKEVTFFATTSPWDDLSKEESTAMRLGTANLVTKLSELLSHKVNERIPTVFEEIKHHSKRLQHEITQLPAPPSGNPQQELLSLLISFAADVKKLVEGSTGFEWFIQSLRDEHGAFHEAIQKSVPEYIPLERKEVEKVVQRSDSHTRRRRRDSSVESAKGAAEVDGNFSASPGKSRRRSNGSDTDSADRPRQKIYLTEIREHLETCRGRELPYTSPPAAKTALINSVTETWLDLMHDCLTEIVPKVRNAVDDLISKHFSRFKGTGLVQLIGSVTHDLIDQLSRTTNDRLEYIEKLEHFPYTQNLHYYQENKDKLLAKFKQQRNDHKKDRANTSGALGTSSVAPVSAPFTFGAPNTSTGSGLPTSAAATAPSPFAFMNPPAPAPVAPKGPSPEAIQAALTSLAAIGINVKKEDLSKLHGNDAWEEEIEMMADVQAYLKISRKRIIDNVPRVIDVSLIRELDNELFRHLQRELKISDPGSGHLAAKWLSESKAVSTKRQDLQASQARVEACMKALREYQTGL